MKDVIMSNLVICPLNVLNFELFNSNPPLLFRYIAVMFFN